jgi:hypothetical protein
MAAAGVAAASSFNNGFIATLKSGQGLAAAFEALKTKMSVGIFGGVSGSYAAY